MFKPIFFVLSCCVLCESFCFADRYIVPTIYENQEEIFVQGSPITVSKMKNSIFFYQTCETIVNNRANFYFNFINQTEHPINLHFSNLKITDQSGRPLRLLHKNELISNKKTEKNWRNFASALCTGLESVNAQNAGKIDYQSSTLSSSRSNLNAQGSQGWASANISTYGSSTTQGTIHSEALRQQALRRVQDDAVQRSAQIHNNYIEWEHGLNNYYFDSTTVFPGSVYNANIQIEVPRALEKELQFIVFAFEVDDEVHPFCFYCGEESK